MPDYEKELNAEQFAAVTSDAEYTLVVAGAGSGKTRAIVYRLAWLVEQGIAPASILLLTFTRKAAHEMVYRAGKLLDEGIGDIFGGTFHGFAYSTLRSFRPAWLEGRPFTLMDSGDISQAISHCREELKIGKKDSSFPKTQTIVNIFSKARNKEKPIQEILSQESYHLLTHASALEDLEAAYGKYRREKGLLDYDDLLFELEDLLRQNGHAAHEVRRRLGHVLVDEYQDTNLVQARIVRLLSEKSGEPGSGSARVMAVGDDAQSIYAFRGANVRNILEFPRLFPGARIIRLEENYRSTQPILNVANNILANASESFKKNLYTRKEGGPEVRLIRPISDASEAAIVTDRIQDLLAEYPPHEIAVLFRSGFHSYALENCLRKAGIDFRKFGGLRFTEAAHIRDILAFARMAINPLDYLAFSRIAAMHKGIGPKTMARLYPLLTQKNGEELEKAFSRYPELVEDLKKVDELRAQALTPQEFFEEILEYYRPRLEKLYTEDWPQRLAGLEEILHMANAYDSLDVFVADVALDTPEQQEEGLENFVTLSTVHSAKGLEWGAVLILDLVEDRFPSRHGQARPEDFEEERRLFYVACTRAKEVLELYTPATIYTRGQHGSAHISQSPFIRELPPKSYQAYVERFGAGITPEGEKKAAKSMDNAGMTQLIEEMVRKKQGEAQPEPIQASASATINMPSIGNAEAGYCRHRIFGRGKIIQRMDNNRVQVNFPGFGMKVILADYLLPEE